MCGRTRLKSQCQQVRDEHMCSNNKILAKIVHNVGGDLASARSTEGFHYYSKHHSHHPLDFLCLWVKVAV